MTRPVRLWSLLLASILAGALVVGLPVWLIQPFAPQTAAAVEWAWSLKQIAPAITTAAALLALASAWGLWRHRSPSAATTGAFRRATGRVALVSLLAVSAAAAWFARQNHFEWMFRPFPDPQFVAASAATDVGADEPVLGVSSGATALAFPITRLGYHHLVNATLGDTPIVATY